MKNLEAVIFAVFVVVGSGMLIGGGLSLRSILAFRASTVPVRGVVMELVRSRRGHQIPVVEWTGADGVSRQVKGNIGYSSSDIAVGDAMTVRYDPSHTEAARVDDNDGSWFGTGIVLLLGTCLVAAGIMVGVLAWGDRRRESQRRRA